MQLAVPLTAVLRGLVVAPVSVSGYVLSLLDLYMLGLRVLLLTESR